MRTVTTFLLLVAMAGTAFAKEVRVTFKGEDDDDKIELIKLEGRQLTFKDGRNPETVDIDAFVPESAFLIKEVFSNSEPESQMDLARFAIHRGLFEKGREIADKLAETTDEYRDRAERLAETARILQADAALDLAEKALDAHDTEKAKPLLERVISRFPDTPASAKAEVLLGTLRRVELEKRALELEKEARDAQKEADAEEQKRRAPIDKWLTELETQVDEQDKLKKEADEDCIGGQTFKGLPKYEDAVQTLKIVRKSLKENRDLLEYRGQDAHADRIDEQARQLMIECYYSWAKYLFESGAYATAATVCEHGIRMDPSDRRLLSLKVDIDLWHDPLDD